MLSTGVPQGGIINSFLYAFYSCNFHKNPFCFNISKLTEANLKTNSKHNTKHKISLVHALHVKTFKTFAMISGISPRNTPMSQIQITMLKQLISFKNSCKNLGHIIDY